MLVDIMSSRSQIRVNVKLIQMFGLQFATYWAEIVDILDRVVEKKKEECLSNDNYITLDRNYITSRTSLTAEEQIACDKALERLEVITRHSSDPNMIRISLNTMISIIAADDAKLIKNLQQTAKLKKTDANKAKKEIIVYNLKNSIVETDLDLFNAYCAWVDAIYESKSFLTKPVIGVFQKTVNTYTDRKEVKLKIIETAMVNGWKDASWAINSYERNSGKKGGAFIGVSQKTGVGIDPNSSF